MTFYSDLAVLSLDLLSEFGQDVTQVTYTAGTYDPATGTTTPTTSSVTRKGAIFHYTAQSINGQQNDRGTLIQGGDKQLLVEAMSSISMQDHFIVGGIEYVIISLAEVNPAGTRVLYDLHLRT